MDDYYKVLAFDLNTHHTGVLGAVLDNSKDEKIITLRSATIEVVNFSVRDHFPYRENKKKILTSPNGEKMHSAYFKPGENHVSVSNKRKRDAEVRQLKNSYQRDHMAYQYSKLLDSVKPNLVLIERNEMFNGTLTIEVLAKLTGLLIGQCVSKGIQYQEHNVKSIRKPYNVTKLCYDFTRGKSPEYLAGLEDVTKMAILDYLMKKYKDLGIDLQTLDESDAGLLFDFWYNYIRRNINSNDR